MDTRPKTQPPQTPEHKISLLGDLQDLDRKLVKLIARRTEIFDKLTQNRRKSSKAALRFAGEEKELRKNWEQAASKLSRDERFLRDTFSLLQELTLLPEHIEERGDNLFNLAPSRKPVAFELPAIASPRESCLWAVLAAEAGADIRLENQSLPDNLIALIKALNQAGAHLSWEQNGIIVNHKGNELEWKDKTIFAGDSVFNFYLLSALALKNPGVVKFTGDSTLKLCDLSAWRNTLPLFGARLAHVIPKTKGLPAHQECSGLLPETAALPEDLPQEAILALMLAAPFWPGKTVFTHTGTAAFASAKKEALPLLAACGVQFDDKESGLSITPGTGLVPQKPELSTCLCSAAILLSLPAFAGGEAKTRGAWPKHEPDADAVLRLLEWAGLKIEIKTGLVASKRSESLSPPKLPLKLNDLPGWAEPLALVLAANHAFHKNKVEIEAEGLGLALAQEFLQLFGMELDEADGATLEIKRSAEGRDPAKQALWTAPAPAWGVAFALGAYLRPNIALTNPALVSGVMPFFWPIYNSLPSPSMQKAKIEEEAAPKPRRKVIAKGVQSDLANLRADYEPEPYE